MSAKQKALIALVLVAVSWGILPLFPRFLDQSFTVLQQLYLRIAAALGCCLVFFYRGYSWKHMVAAPRRDILLLLVRSVSYWLIGAAALTASLLRTSVGNAMVIQAIPMSAILGILFFRERMTVERMLLAGLSVVGVILVSIDPNSGLTGSFGEGELLSLLSIAAFSFSLVSRKWQTTYLNDRELSILTLVFAMVSTVALSVARGEGLPVWNGDLSLMGIILVSGIIISGMTLFLSYGYRHVDAVVAIPILSLETVISVVLAWFIFSEPPTVRMMLGGLCILGSSIMMQRYAFRRAKAT